MSFFSKRSSAQALSAISSPFGTTQRTRRRPAKPQDPSMPPEDVPIPVSYSSRPVSIPDDFLSLTTPPADAQEVAARQIQWRDTELSVHGDRYAVVLDGILSPSECQEMLRLAEASVETNESRADGPGQQQQQEEDGGNGVDGSGEGEPVPEWQKKVWRPALVNAGPGWEVYTPSYRKGSRIIWDEQEVVDRLWARCVKAAPELVGKRLEVVETPDPALGTAARGQESWECRGLNKRMRFLKYGPGDFFQPHCDASYREEGSDPPRRTLFTMHLYLNDAQEAVGKDASAELCGGATSFFTPDERKKMDVDCKTGRVLIFQHYGLTHSGDEVRAGTKYTMRSDLMYELVRLD